jgi:glutamate synthase domain-containing protein 2
MRIGVEMAIGLGGVLLTAAAIGIFVWRPVVNYWIDAFVKRLLKDPYPENIAEMYNVLKKVGIQNVLESELRANCGNALPRPFGSPIHFSRWEQLLFSPVYLHRQPLVEAAPVDMSVILGPQAKRPLTIENPIMIGGMGYGFGPSLKAKIALAKAAAQAKTATNTGVGPFLAEERKAAQKLIVQYHRGSWGKEEIFLRQADMVEIQLGYGALGSAPVSLSPADISEEFRDYMKLGNQESLHLTAALEDASDGKELSKLVRYLRKLTNGVPIGVKIGATHYLERELAILTEAELDFINIDGAEAGINFGPTILADSCGLPTLPALCRAKKYLQQHGPARKMSLIVSGGLTTPGHFLKALALGADAVYIGTIAMILLVHCQSSKVLPWEPPTELVYERGKYKDRLNVNEAAQALANYLESCKQEMIMGMRTLGRASLAELSSADLAALSEEVAEMTGVELGLFAPSQQKRNESH